MRRVILPAAFLSSLVFAAVAVAVQPEPFWRAPEPGLASSEAPALDELFPLEGVAWANCESECVASYNNCMASCNGDFGCENACSTGLWICACNCSGGPIYC